MNDKNIVNLDDARKKKASELKKSLNPNKFKFWHWFQFLGLLAITSLMLKKCGM